jgi:beta-lactamase regulating signal transducer with metallopeptidase domain
VIIQAFIRGAIVIAIAALVATLLRHRSAALRHHVWATAVVVQLALLAFIPVLPRITLPILPTIVVRTDAPLDASAALAEERSADVSGNAAVTTPPNVNSAAQPRSPSAAAASRRTFGDYVLMAWILGAAIILARYIIGTLLMMRVAIKGDRVEDGDWLVLAQRTARELGITRPVTMIWGDNVSVPITWGVLYPMILLPKSAQEWPAERRRFVLVHEMAHVKRFDAFTQLLAQITAAIFWFSPFVWIAEWRMRVEREHACDDTVIQHGTEPALYADELLQMVRSLVRRRAQQPAFAALAMARKSEFEGRMLAILDPERPRRVTGITSGVMFALLSVLIAAPLAAIDPYAFRVETAPTQTKASEPLAPVARPEVPSQPASQTAAITKEECNFDLGGEGTTANVGSDNSVSVRLRRGARCVLGDVSGAVTISPDERRILAVNTGGFLKLRELTPGRDVQLVIDHASRGGLWRAFTINGRVPDDDGRNEREWVARVLPELMSEGGIRVQERVQRMLQSNGLSGTLRQLSAMSSASTRLMHFKALVEIGDWTPAELERIKAAAAQALPARDLANFNRLLTRAPQKPDSQKRVSTDAELLEQILRGISSGYDLRMAIKSQLPRADRTTLLMFMRVAANMSSGYELASLLGEAAEYYLGKDAGLEDAWFRTASQIMSSDSRRSALTFILDRAKNNERITLKTLNAMNGMSSGVDRALLLTAIAEKKLLTTPELRTAFLGQVNALSSSVDRRLVLEKL